MSKDTADKTIVMFYAQSFYKMRNMTLEQVGMFHMACLAHAVGEPYEVNDPFVNYCLEEFKDAFAKQQENRQAFIEKQRLNGAKGGRPRKNPNNPSLNLGYENETQNNPTVISENPSITQKTLITSNELQVTSNKNSCNTICAESETDSAPPPPSDDDSQTNSPSKKQQADPDPDDILLTFNCIKGEQYHFTKADFEMYAQTYPAVDVMAEVRKMQTWLVTNPTKIKTKRGMPAFINRWLSETQNKRPNANFSNNTQIYRGNSSADERIRNNYLKGIAILQRQTEQ